VAAWLLVLALVVPAGAVEGPTKLYDPSVSARTATPTTTITFTVEYRNREGSAPAWVRVVIDGVAHNMTGDGGDDWKKGVGHHFATKLPAGTHKVSFAAADTRKFTDKVNGGTVKIAVPTTPTPTPSPKPTPTPDPTPTPAPGDGPGGSGGTDGNGGTPATQGADGIGAPGSGVGPGAGGATDDSMSGGLYTNALQTWGYGTGGPDGDSALGAGSGSGSGSGSNDDGPPSAGAVVAGAAAGLTGGGPDDVSGPGSGGSRRGGGTDGNGGSSAGGSSSGSGGSSGWGALTAALDALGIQSGPATMPLLPTLVGTTGAAAMAMAFAIFGKKRRDEEQPAPDEVLQANAARGTNEPASSELMRGVVATAAVATPIDLEASMPRWRRPSLQQARKADPTRNGYVAPKLTFADADGAGIGYERRVIRYRVVRLLDAPDELRSVEIGQLDQGDEVQLLEKSGAYWLVRCPDGRQGWLHKMTLGDVVTDEATSAAEAWNVGDIDGDVLSAYLAARARA
jgi:hypothetical protein